jgi:polysaccharide biosynthesis protein PelG
MAGIGFVLRKLARQDTLFSGVRAYSHAAVVSCGPWLFVVLSLGGIQLLGRAMLAPQDLQRFSAVVTYDFSFSLVAAGPIALVLTRRLADQIYAKAVADVPSLFLNALLLLFGVQAVFGIPFYCFFVDMPPAERVLALICLQVAGGIWIASPFISALQSFGTISAAFAAGTLVAFVAAVLLAPVLGAAGMLAGFTVGLASILFGLAARIFAEYPYPARLRFWFILDFRRYWQFAVVGLLYNAAIWVDKWIMWFAPGRVMIAGGIATNPAYDGAMFLAYLSIVPATTLFLVAVETRFFEHYLRFYQNIENHGTAAEIERNHATILSVLGEGMRNITVLQVAVCYLAILAAPGLIDMAQGGLEMIPIFRFGTFGALFHVLLLCAMVVLSYFDLRRELVRVTAVFFILNAGLTWGALWLGLGYQGYGYAGATLLSLIYAYSLLSSRIAQLPYVTFIGNNRALR